MFNLRLKKYQFVYLYFVQNEIGPWWRPVFVCDGQAFSFTIDHVTNYYLFICIDYLRATGDCDSVVKIICFTTKQCILNYLYSLAVDTRKMWHSSVAAHQAKPQNKATSKHTTMLFTKSDLILNRV